MHPQLLPVLCVLIFGKPNPLPPDSLQFARRLDSLAASPLMQHGSVAGSLQRVKTGRTVVSFNARRSMPPASTMKLVTTATALAVLGPAYTYATRLDYDGPLRADTLRGNLRIRGLGDPALGSGRFALSPDLPWQLARWVAAVRGAGIRVIEGRVLADDLFFGENPTPGGWPYDDLGNYYGAAPSGLTINENSYRVFFRPADTLGGPAPVLRLEPPVPYLAFDNFVRTEAPGTGDQVTIFAGPLGGRVLLAGTVPGGEADFSVKGSLPDPGFFAAQALHAALLAAGIKVLGPPPTSLGQLRQQQPGYALLPTAGDLHRQLSPPLRDLARECNFQSINLYAEAFLKTVGIALGVGPSTEQGVGALKQVWQDKGLNLSGFRPLDGSGLSPQSGVTAQNMTDILMAAAREPWFPQFYASIPVLGVSGTVRNLGKRSRAAGNVRAKSGSIGGVRAFAGYFTARTGGLVAFCFFLQGYDATAGSATRELEKLMVAMVEW